MNDELGDWRKQIDDIDKKIINYLAKRVEIVRKIGKFKKDQKISAFDKKRWNQVMESNLDKAKSLHLPEDFVKKLLTIIHKYSLKLQK